MQKAKVGTGTTVHHSSEKLPGVSTVKTSDVDALPDGFSHKLFSTRAKEVDDPRANKANDALFGTRNDHTNKYVDGKKDRLSDDSSDVKMIRKSKDKGAC